jgi:hypothetical protein
MIKIMRTYFILLILFLLLSCFIACTNDKNNDDDDDNDDDTSPACEPTCWQNSPDQATGSLDQMEQWAEECKNADSGCPGRYCAATRLEYKNAPEGLKYAVQCESAVDNDNYCEYYWGGGDIAEYHWLGPEYGMLEDNSIYVCNQNINDAWTVTGWALVPGGTNKKWTSDKIEDSLVHEISATECETITDLRTCIRSFIPPDIHCTPAFSKIDYLTFIGCESKQEPFNRPLGWREKYQD